MSYKKPLFCVWQILHLISIGCIFAFKIRASDAKFNTSTDAIIPLKGVVLVSNNSSN